MMEARKHAAWYVCHAVFSRSAANLRKTLCGEIKSMDSDVLNIVRTAINNQSGIIG